MSDDIIVIGAGASGLMAARQLSENGMKVLILEADLRPGGRIHTLQDPLFPVPLELGAEFIHGKLPLTFTLLKEAGIRWENDEDEMIKIRDGKYTKNDGFIVGWDEMIAKMKSVRTDMSLKAFLDLHYPHEEDQAFRSEIIRFAEGFDLADVDQASVQSLLDEWSAEDQPQFRLPGGYSQLVDHLVTCCKNNGCRVLYDMQVNKVEWRRGRVVVKTRNGKVLEGRKVIISVPLGILQSIDTSKQLIEFNPPVATLIRNTKHIGYGSVIKYFALFENFFSGELRKPAFVLGDQIVPTWWIRFVGENVLLSGWLGGPEAKRHSRLTTAAYREQALISIAQMFKVSKAEIESRLKAFRAINWSTQPYAMGAYSYDLVGSKEVKKLFKQPLANTIYFAGEGLHDGPAPGTVEAALSNGKEAALKMMASWHMNNA